MTNKLTYGELNLPFYLNSQPVFANLTASDLAKAAVLAPLNLFLVGDTGTGKSLLASDIYDNYFGGNISEGGQGVFIRANPETDIHNEIFTKLNVEKAKRELTPNLEAMIFDVDELNRLPAVGQNQFFGLGDGSMDYQGRSIKLGKEGYYILVGTANLGNGEFQGTFETDKAMHNRLHVTLDLDYERLAPTNSDLIELNRRQPNPNVKKGDTRDISDKILQASREIGEISSNLGLESLAVLDYLTFGLDNCQRNIVDNGGNRKGKIWPIKCQDCSFNTSDEALCSLIRSPVPRTLQSVSKYASALQYLALLKNPKVKIDPVELTFKSFELTGAYQSLLNPETLRKDHFGQNPEMMGNVVDRLKEDFRTNKDYIMTSLEEAIKGKKVNRFFVYDGQFGEYDSLSDKAKDSLGINPLEPFNNNREVGLSYVNDVVDNMVGQYTDKNNDSNPSKKSKKSKPKDSKDE